MADLPFVILAVAFLLLIAEIAHLAPHRPAHMCAVASVPATCGDVR
jgi:hypothetical protein